MNHRSVVLSTAIALMGASSAWAQMVPPPAETPAPEKAIPVTPPSPIPTVSPADPKPAPVTVRPVKEKAAPVVLPNIPHEPLAKKGADGKIVRLQEPVEYAALRANPMVTDKEREQIAEHLKQRKASFEILVADNLDLVEKIEAGIFESIPLQEDADKKKNLPELIAVAKPLKPKAAPDPVYLDLRNKGVFTPEQSEFNRKISFEYYQAVIAEMKVDAARGLALTYKQYLDEPMYYHRLMLIEAAGKLDSLLPGLNLDSETAAKIKPAAAKAKAAKTDAEKEAAMRELGQGLSLDQRKALLKAVIASRGEKN